MLSPYIQGFCLGGGLIVAIGAQNAHVLSLALKGRHHLVSAAICTACDVILISAGVLGLGLAVAANPNFTRLAAWAGAAFLFWYGLRSFRSVFNDNRLQAEARQATLRQAILTTLAVTLLNPHVYLDTVVLTGAVSGQFPHPQRLIFGLGAMTASLVWFTSLSLGGRALAPLFRKPVAWKALDAGIGLIMWTLALSLASGRITS